jgi:hypothetical protein
MRRARGLRVGRVPVVAAAHMRRARGLRRVGRVPVVAAVASSRRRRWAGPGRRCRREASCTGLLDLTSPRPPTRARPRGALMQSIDLPHTASAGTRGGVTGVFCTRSHLTGFGSRASRGRSRQDRRESRRMLCPWHYVGEGSSQHCPLDSHRPARTVRRRGAQELTTLSRKHTHALRVLVFGF